MLPSQDVDISRDDESHRSGLTATAFPEANGSQTGVSVENVPNEKLQWYVLRVSYGRAEKANDLLMSKNVKTYLPLHTQYKEVNGKRRKQRVPMLPNFLFVHTTLSSLKTILKSITNKTLITFYYDHFATTEDGKNPPLVVPNSAMDNFIKLTSIDDENIILIDHVNGKFKKGDQVHIVEGPFKGIEGRVTKITGQKRVIVELPGLCSVATAYVPKAFIKNNEDNER